MKFILFILLCNQLFCNAQDTIYQTNVPEHDIQMLVADPIGRVFLAKNNRLWCLAVNGTVEWTWQNSLFSSIYQIDANNPLKILLFYKEQNFIEILDKNGKLINAIDLSAFGYTDITAAALAADNSIWIFDQQQKALLNISATGTLLSKSIDISILTSTIAISTSITLSSTNVYLCINQSEIVCFDTKSSFKKTKRIPAGSTVINITNSDNICYQQLNKIVSQSLINQSLERTIVELFSAKSLAYIAESLYFISDNKIIKQGIGSSN